MAAPERFPANPVRIGVWNLDGGATMILADMATYLACWSGRGRC